MGRWKEEGGKGGCLMLINKANVNQGKNKAMYIGDGGVCTIYRRRERKEEKPQY